MTDWLQNSLLIITQVVMLVGLFGLIVPVYPGTVIMWLAALGYGLLAGFSTLGAVLFGIITILMLVSTIVDNLLMGLSARQGGASWTTILVALLAGVIGTLVFPPLGGIIAAPLAVLGLEYQRRRDWQQAWQALRGLAAGWGLSFVARFFLGAAMMGLWWLWVWKG